MRCVFSRLANVSADKSHQRSSTGSLFHTVGPFTAKLLAPIDVLVFGTNRMPVVADRSRYLSSVNDRSSVNESALILYPTVQSMRPTLLHWHRPSVLHIAASLT